MSYGPRKKSLLVGINYIGSQNELRGCHQDIENVAEFLSYRGYSDDSHSQVILRDDQGGPYYPSGANILAAIDWLVRDPGTCCFFHYSGTRLFDSGEHRVVANYGPQVMVAKYPTRLASIPLDVKTPHSGHCDSAIADAVIVLDTIVPVDFQERGQINSDLLHQHLVSALPPNSTLFVVLDCCHSGSALQLPFVYKSDDDGNVSVLDNVKEGMRLMAESADILNGGFSFAKLAEAKDLYAGATDFFRGLRHRNDPEGLGNSQYAGDYGNEAKTVTMFSGCRDEQTSADAQINGVNEGAMTWAFLETMKQGGGDSYLSTLQQTRYALRGSNYPQVPQLSVGYQIDLNQPLIL